MCNFLLCHKVDKPCVRITSFPIRLLTFLKGSQATRCWMCVWFQPAAAAGLCSSKTPIPPDLYHSFFKTPERSSVCVINYTAFSFGVRVCSSRLLICCHFHASERSIFHSFCCCCCSGFKRFPRSARRDRRRQEERMLGTFSKLPLKCDVRERTKSRWYLFRGVGGGGVGVGDGKGGQEQHLLPGQSDPICRRRRGTSLTWTLTPTRNFALTENMS